MGEKANIYFVYTPLGTVLNMLSFKHQQKSCTVGLIISF